MVDSSRNAVKPVAPEPAVAPGRAPSTAVGRALTAAALVGRVAQPVGGVVLPHLLGPVLECLGEMGGGDVVGARKVGDGAG